MKRQNGITVEDVLRLDCLEKSKLIAGSKGCRNTVSKVNIMADPDAMDWVSPGELLLTTAYFFKKDDQEAQKQLIRDCSQKNLAGIGIKIYPYLEMLSEEVIELANQLNFPIIDIYYATPFSDITSRIFKEIFNKQASLLERIESVHEKLMEVVLKEGGFREITEVIHENIKNPVVIKIAFPDQLYQDMATVDDKTKNALLDNVNRFYNTNRQFEKVFDESVETITSKPIRRMVMPIIVKNNIYGHIFAWNIDTPLGGFDLSVMESASTTIALEILKQISVRDVENRYKAEFLEDLFSMEDKRKEKAIERAVVFKLGINDEYVISIIQLNFLKELDVAAVQNQIHFLNGTTERLINELSLNALVASKTDSIYVLCSFSNSKLISSTIKDFSGRLEKIIAQNLKVEYKIGIGRAYKGLSNIYKSYVDASKALRTGEVIDDRSVVYFDQLGIYKILCQDSLTEELEKFYDATIQPLIDYDKKKSTELVKTLEVYFEHNGNLKRISDTLFTHYNTTLYRLQRLQKITAMDLDNHKDRLNLEIALKIKRLLKK